MAGALAGKSGLGQLLELGVDAFHQLVARALVAAGPATKDGGELSALFGHDSRADGPPLFQDSISQCSQACTARQVRLDRPMRRESDTKSIGNALLGVSDSVEEHCPCVKNRDHVTAARRALLHHFWASWSSWRT